MKKQLILVVIFALVAQSLFALEKISGIAVDNLGKPIAGVNISVDGIKSQYSTGENGEFSIDVDLPVSHFLTFSHISYLPVMVRAASTEPLRIEMKLATYPLQGVTVSDDRATLGKTPVAFSDFTAREIKRDYTAGEFPLLLETTPNVYAYADAGGGLGYSYLKIRGFDDKRVSVYINGVPLNDPEDQATYFVDIPDFAASVKDIQVQRGIGNSLYGDASFGGSVNIVSSGLEQQRKVSVTSGYGGFYDHGKFIGDMQKQSLEYRSGLIDGKWNLSVRYSRQLSDGYRENSWYNGWAYYLSVSRLDPKVTTTLNVYGGPMRMHLAYYGVSRDKLFEDRRYNPLTYSNETDNFNQPHYELHNTIILSDNETLYNTLYHIHGDGFYEQYKEQRDFAEYNLSPSYILDEAGDTVKAITSGDLVRQQWVNKNQWGWSPRLEFEQSKGTFGIGGSFYYFDSDHWGQVVWAQGLTDQIDPRHRYYEYFGKKYFGSLYAVENYKVSDKLNLFGNLQLRDQDYKFRQTKMGTFQGYNYDVNWAFISPRVGVTYSLSENASMLFNYSLSSRAPADYEIYDAGDPTAFPSLQIESVTHISPTDSTIVFGDPTAKAERVHNFELGLNYHDKRQTYAANLFWMEFRNEIVQFGGINYNLGLPITTNVDRSVHAGIELASTQNISKYLKLSGNFSVSYNRIKDFKVSEPVYDNDQDYNFVGYETFNYDNKKISGFPGYIGNLISEYGNDNFGFVYRARLIGRTYVENSNREELSIPPFFVSSVSGNISLGKLIHIGNLELNARFDNIFDKRYEASGYGGVTRFRDIPSQYWAEYIPAAGRSFFATLKLEMQ